MKIVRDVAFGCDWVRDELNKRVTSQAVSGIRKGMSD